MTFNQFQMYTIFFLLGFCDKSLKREMEMGRQDCAIVKSYMYIIKYIFMGEITARAI